LAALLRALVAMPGLVWLRLSSMLPAYFSHELCEVLTGTPVIAPHFHVPLQSGSDRVLRTMRRPYSVRMYRAVVERLAGAVPVLETRDPATGALLGLTGHYVEVPFDGPDALVRRMARVRIGPGGRGELVDGALP